MKPQLMIVAGSLLALIIGLATAYPLFASDFPSLMSIETDVDVVYAYISATVSNTNITGLWRNQSSVLETSNQVFSYLIVLNVTNYSNESVRIDRLTAVIGPKVSATEGSLHAASINAVVIDSRQTSGSFPFDNTIMPYASKLIGLSGITGSPARFYEALNNNIFLYGGIESQLAYRVSRLTIANSLKQVQLHNVGGDYLYNELLQENKMLRLFNGGLDVVIVARD